MNILPNRKIPPPIYDIESGITPWPKQENDIKEGISLFVLKVQNAEFSKVELIFDAGKWYDTYNGISYFTGHMLLEGTKNKSSQEISQYIDQFGAILDVDVTNDICSITLLTLPKFLDPMLTLLVELLSESTFPEDRLLHIKQLKKQSLAVENSKTNRVCAKKFLELLYTTSYPYGRNLNEEDIDKFTSEDLNSFYNDKFTSKCKVILSGKVTNKELELVNKHIKNLSISNKCNYSSYNYVEASPQKMHLEVRNGLQTSIMLGKVLFNQSNEDYSSMVLVNTLLGGYFGSRLMRNIREKKGYTYGIYSRIIPLRYSGYWIIKTDVAREFVKETLTEIEIEIKKLQTVAVPDNELKLVKNYLAGSLLYEMNSIFAISEKFKSLSIINMDSSFYHRLSATIDKLNAKQIMDIASKYLNCECFSMVTVC